MKALVVDDDQRITATLKRILGDEFVVEMCSTAHEAEYLAFNNFYDIIILDLLLPDMDGEDLTTVLKSRIPDTPIIALSAKNKPHEKQFAFECGVDDYIVKPIAARELKARVKAQIRKNPDKKSISNKKYKVRDLIYDKDRRMVFYQDKWIKLRKKEMLVLEYMIVNKGRVVSRDDILESVWDSDTNPFSNTVDVHVKRLREKIEDPYNEKYIHTVHGLGYLFE